MNKTMIQKCANNIRGVVADTVQKANSGHPGMPIGTADFVATLWSEFLNFNPQKPDWINRDRFVLSAGHGSTLLYSLLHLFGYDVTLDDLKNFRQWGSKTAGHPEYGALPGIECTTGPLGQGISMAVGMALAAKMAAARFNTDKYPVIDHYVYAISGDGCLMEGVSAEASSLAGHLKLDNLILLYDSNNITIEGNTELAFTEDVAARYAAYGWKVFHADGHDIDKIYEAIEVAKAVTGAPKIVIMKTHIACHAPTLHDKSASHGSPLGDEEIKGLKKNIDLPEDKFFYIDDEVRAFCKSRLEEKLAKYAAWAEMFENWRRDEPQKAELFDKMVERKVPENLYREIFEEIPDKKEATRVSSGRAIQKLAAALDWTVGGSADLEPSIKCLVKNSTSITADSFAGRNFHFGIREHAMGAISNGVALYGLFQPYCATFLVFSDYMKGALRLSSIMGLPVVYIYTHDSIFLGEDGPTHQPIEQLGALRIIPNMTVIRPADAYETAAAWLMALESKKSPVALILSRQGVPQLHSGDFNYELFKKGAYAIHDCEEPKLIIMATGSEVATAVDAAKLLEAKGTKVRVISVPSIEIFEAQDEEYRTKLLPAGVPIFALEASLTHDFDRYTYPTGGEFIGLNSFGASAPSAVLAEKFGFTGEAVAEKIEAVLK